MAELPHTHDTGSRCLACAAELIADDIGAGMRPSPLPVHEALTLLVATVASQQAERAHLEEGARLVLDRWLTAERARRALASGRASAKAEQAPAQGKVEPLQRTNAELIATVRKGLSVVYWKAGANSAAARATIAAKDALTELEKRIGGE